ncbi:DUF998 domain-containing protein [Pseudoclavibacter sp. RFBA6]|nr:DUF998 domain-containing protein [Pseudoclavibacter sp. RFBA6]
MLAAAVTALLVQGEYLPIGGPDSLGARAGWISAALAAISFAATHAIPDVGADPSVLSWRRQLPIAKRLVDMLALAAGVAMLTFFVVIAVAQVFQIGFRGLTVDPLGGGALVGFTAAATSYAASLFGARTTGIAIAALAVAVLFMGTFASMISSPDESWWQLHFSQLGNTAGITGYRFNLALMVTGLVITTLAGYTGRSFDLGLAARGFHAGARIHLLPWLLGGIGICMIGVGLVPDAVNKPLHVAFAAGMVVLFGAFALGALRFIHGLPRELRIFTLVVMAGIVFAILLWEPIRYYSLAGMEFISAGLLFAWLIVFTRAADAYGTETPPAGQDRSPG